MDGFFPFMTQDIMLAPDESAHLHEDDGGAGHGAEGAADEEPRNVAAVAFHVLQQVLPVLLRRAVLPPTHRRLVVVSAWRHILHLFSQCVISQGKFKQSALRGTSALPQAPR